MDFERRIARLRGTHLEPELPKSFENRRVEVIVLPLEEGPNPGDQRGPHPSLADATAIHGDLINTIAPEDWDLP